MKKHEEQRFEFLLTKNGKNIICQRFFHIKGFNKDILKDYEEMKRLLDDCTDLIQEDLKQKSDDYMWKYFNPYKAQTEESIDKTKIDYNDNFEFEIRVDKQRVAIKTFPAGIYPPNVRYYVNIKHLVQSIISDIQHTLSSRKKITKYVPSEVV